MIRSSHLSFLLSEHWYGYLKVACDEVSVLRKLAVRHITEFHTDLPHRCFIASTCIVCQSCKSREVGCQKLIRSQLVGALPYKTFLDIGGKVPVCVAEPARIHCNMLTQGQFSYDQG